MWCGLQESDSESPSEIGVRSLSFWWKLFSCSLSISLCAEPPSVSSMACIMDSLSWATASMILRISGKSLRTAWKSSTCSEYRSQTVTARTLATRLDLRSRHISNSRAGTMHTVHTPGKQELQYTGTVNTRQSTAISFQRIWWINEFGRLTGYSLVLVHYICTGKLWRIERFGG